MVTFNNILKAYLNSKLPFAILIDGNWGSGKTWFLKNGFKKEFEKKIVYTSANGIESVDDISEQILYKRLYLKNKLVKDPKAKLAWGITKQVGSALVQKFTGYDTKDAKKLGIELHEFASLKDDEVLVIDDIERMNNSVTLEQLFGFVSTNFTEENGFKVIMVADEAKLIEKLKQDEIESDYYQTIKEKTIWQTIRFKPDFKKVYKSLIKGYKENEKNYKVLRDQREYLLSKFKLYKINNIRTVLYFLHVVNRIFSEIGDLEDEKTIKLLLNTSLILSNEFKQGNFSNKEEKEVPEYVQINSPTYNISMIEIEEGIDVSDRKESKFSYKYLEKDGDKYYFFQSIYDLVCYGHFDFELFGVERDDYINSKNNLKEWHLAVDKLSNLLSLEENEFVESWKTVINNVELNNYGVNDLKNIASIYERYSHAGIKFLTEPDLFYKILTKSLNQKPYYDAKFGRQDIYRGDIKKKNEKMYLEFNKKVNEVEAKLFQEDKNNQIEELLTSLNDGKFSKDQWFETILNFGTEDQIDRFASATTSSVKTCNFVGKYGVIDK